MPGSWVLWEERDEAQPPVGALGVGAVGEQIVEFDAQALGKSGDVRHAPHLPRHQHRDRGIAAHAPASSCQRISQPPPQPTSARPDA